MVHIVAKDNSEESKDKRIESPFTTFTDNHRYHYNRTESDALRPPPERVKGNPSWYHMRKFLLDGLRPVGKYTVPTMPGDYPARLNDLFWQGDELMDKTDIRLTHPSEQNIMEEIR